MTTAEAPTSTPEPPRRSGIHAAGGDGEAGGAPLGPEPAEVSVSADLDIPGETGRQTRVFAAWVLCLALAVVLGSIVGAHVSPWDRGTAAGDRELARSRSAKLKVALAVGLVLPAALTFAIGRHHRRGGRHARGITVDVTTAPEELRVWGRGYGSRLPLGGATATERFVDVYAGRLGAWRQRRLRIVRAAGSAARGGVSQIELATPAVSSDADDVLRVEGGEGDCLELERGDYERIRAAVLGALAPRVAAPSPPDPLPEAEADGAEEGAAHRGRAAARVGG